MVRTVQDDRTSSGGTRGGVRRQANGGQGGYRQQPDVADKLCGAGDSDPDHLQGRQAGLNPGWRAAQEPVEGLDQFADLSSPGQIRPRAAAASPAERGGFARAARSRSVAVEPAG